MKAFAKLMALVLALVLALSLTACKKEGEMAQAAPAPATAGPAPATAAPAPVPATSAPVPATAAPVPATDAPEAASYLGVYRFESVGGKSFEEYMLSFVSSEEDFIAQTGMTLAEAQNALTFNLNADGSLIINEIGTEPTTGRWTAEGNTVTISVNGVAVEYTYDNGILSGTNSDGIFVVLKQIG